MKKICLWVLMVVVLLGLSACAQPAGAIVQSEKHRVTSPDVNDTDLADLINGSSAFALDLYQILRARNDNLLYSPYSISAALAMTYAGARGETEQEMADALSFLLSQEKLHPAFNALDLRLAEQDEPVGEEEGEVFQLSIANAVWGEKDHEFLAPFLDTLAEHYGAGLRLLDFVNEAEKARETINAWVSDQTEERIPELLPPTSVDAMTRMVLANTVYFLGGWLHRFNAQQTEERDFYAHGEHTQKVPMMRQQASFGHASADGAQILELPYQGEELSMLLVLPDQRNGLAKVGSELTMKRIERWSSLLRPTKVLVHLPRCEVRHASRLKAPLQELGLKRAFEDVLADFSGIAAKGEVYLDDAYHGVIVRVHEQGSGAAATAALPAKSSAPELIPEFIADHPFLFVVRVARSGTILFLGRVVDPAA